MEHDGDTGERAQIGAAEGPPVAVLSSEGERLILDVLTEHADSLLATARRNSLCLDDAHDAYQRALEIFTKRVGRLTPEMAPGWLHVVVRNEAHAVRTSRMRLVGGGSLDHDDGPHPAADAPTPEERALGTDRAARAAEALKRLKADELRAMWLRALGLSYAEIAEETGWTRTKVNRCLTEGRSAFLQRYEGIESGQECERWRPLLSAIVDGEATSAEMLDVRPHLRNCRACRATLKEISQTDRALRVVLPVGAVVTAGRAAGLLDRARPIAGAGDGLLAGGAGSAGALVTKAVALLAVASTSVTVAGSGGQPAVAAAPLTRPAVLQTRHAARIESVAAVPAAAPARRVDGGGQAGGATPGGVTQADRRAAVAAREFVPPRAPEPSLPPRTPTQDEFTP